MRSVSVPLGGRCLDRVTPAQANAAAGSGLRGGCVTSAWRGMCVEQLGSSVRLTCHLLFLFLPYRWPFVVVFCRLKCYLEIT